MSSRLALAAFYILPPLSIIFGRVGAASIKLILVFQCYLSKRGVCSAFPHCFVSTAEFHLRGGSLLFIVPPAVGGRRPQTTQYIDGHFLGGRSNIYFTFFSKRDHSGICHSRCHFGLLCDTEYRVLPSKIL